MKPFTATIHPQVAVDINNLGSVLQELGDFHGAKAAFQRALGYLQKGFRPRSPQNRAGAPQPSRPEPLALSPLDTMPCRGGSRTSPKRPFALIQLALAIITR